MDVGDQIPLRVQLFDGDTTKSVVAFVYTSSDSFISGGPVTLTHLGGGLYGNSTKLFPLDTLLKAQYVVYDYAGGPESTIHAETLQIISTDLELCSDLSAIPATLLNLQLLLFDGDGTKVCKVNIYKADNSLVSGSPFTMSHVSNGRYKLDTEQMPNSEFVFCQFLVYEGDGVTLSTLHGVSMDIYLRGPGSPSSFDTGNVVTGSLSGGAISGIIE